MGGVLGGNGSNVLKHVALGYSIVNGPVPGLLRDMVESTALDQTNRLENATQNRVVVSLALIFFSRRNDCLGSWLCGKCSVMKKKKKTQIFNSLLNSISFSLKRMVGGVLGGNGANALKLVALGHSIANERVPGLLRDMVESLALDQTNRLENATQNRVVVSLTLTFFSP